jgi:hypothetical protein
MNAAAAGRPRSPLAAPAGAQALAAFVAAAALLWAVTHVPQRGWQPPAEVAVALDGEHYRVAPHELRWIETFSTLHFSEGEDRARDIVATEVDVQLDRIFTGIRSRLPDFIDWYYSLRGEYSRVAMAALSYANLAEPDYVAERAASMLLPDEIWAEGFATLERQAAERLLAHHEQVREDWLADVTRRLSAHRVPAPLPTPQSSADGRVRLDPLIGQIAARERAALETRLSLSTLAAGGAAAGPALWRAVAARTSATAGRAAAARAAGRGAARAGSAAAGGAAVCSPGGPAAVGCALIAGAAAWLGTDWALLRIDEHLHRDDFEAALDAGLAALRQQIEQDLLDGYDALIAAHYGSVKQDISRGFVPAHAGDASAAQ